MPSLGPQVPLASKLALLLGKKRDKVGKTPSTRAIATATAQEAGGKPAMTHQVVNELLTGEKTDPKLSQLLGLARAFETPVSFLLPGYNGLTSLTVYEEYPEAREALRLIHDLGPGGAHELLEAAREIRSRHGRSNLTVPEIPEPLPAVPEAPRPGRRRRLSFDEAAQRAASDLEGP
ncbi:hypothetical protein [Streptomyces sp. Qhu_M48]|uniref:hypothetical protein n=1 Tax=Streptomyces sp. Qhu_M48 TaxID=3435889 RepID=UPI003F504508